MAELIPVAIRPFVESDRPFVSNSWFRSCRDTMPAMRNMRTADLCAFQSRRIDALLADESNWVCVVHPVDTPSVIVAWACRGQPATILHYVYTSQAYRNRGFARDLCKGVEFCTHETDSKRADSFARWRHRAGIRYIPHLLDGTSQP
jgi:hypothetical protein